MKRYINTVVLALVVFSVSIYAQTSKDGQVRAKDPTTVTVRDKAQQVETVAGSAGEPQPAKGGKFVRGIKAGARKTWNGVVDLTGWMFNTDQDVPADRERTSGTDTKKR